MTAPRITAAATVACLALVACREPTESPAGTIAPESTTSTLPVIEGSFDVGGRSLYLRCRGDGEPTVVYLHGYIFEPSGGGSGNAGAFPRALEDDYRVCVYDRANVGQSDTADGRQTGADSVRDLEALLAAAEVPGPFVLVGASFGGLLAFMYASTHPSEVVGMVLLDGNLPRDPDVEAQFGFPFPPNEWETTTEHVDRASTYEEARALEPSAPDIPVTYLAVADPDLNPSFPENEQLALIAEIRQAFLALFPQAVLGTVHAPHYMEPVIPDRIAQEVRAVLGSAG